jgi:hypothetical protein
MILLHHKALVVPPLLKVMLGAVAPSETFALAGELKRTTQQTTTKSVVLALEGVPMRALASNSSLVKMTRSGISVP